MTNTGKDMTLDTFTGRQQFVTLCKECYHYSLEAVNSRHDLKANRTDREDKAIQV